MVRRSVLVLLVPFGTRILLVGSASHGPNAATVGDSGLVAVYEAGVLELTGVFEKSVYETVLATVVYQNSSQEPDVSDRRIRLTVTDNPGSASNTVELLLHVVSVDDPPFLDLDGIGPGLD